MKVIYYRYKYRKGWNCSRTCETPEEYKTWLKHDKKYHDLKFTSDGYICYIDY